MNKELSGEPSGSTNEGNFYWLKGRDVWIRARTNALAHKLAAKQLDKTANVVFLLEKIFVIVPIVCIGVSLYYVSAVQNFNASTIAIPAGQFYMLMGIAAIISNGFALFLHLVSTRFKWSERSLQHRILLSNYITIAQKSRRLDSSEISHEEAKHLYRHLQETFEINKSNEFEPSDKMFSEAVKKLLDLKPYPFNLNADQLKQLI